MNWKALSMSPTHPGTRTRHRSLTVWAFKGKDTGPSWIEEAVWRRLEIFLYQRAWRADEPRPFFFFFLNAPKASLAHQFLVGEQLEVPLSLACLFLPRGSRAVVAVAVGGDGGSEGGGGGTWTVCPGGTYPIQHTDTLTLFYRHLHNTSCSH